MKKLKHSKYRNTGLIFELLSRKLVQETLANTQLKALRLITKYFSHSKPLAQELKLYSCLTEGKLDAQLVERIVDTVEKINEKLDNKLLEAARFSLVRDIKNNYGLDDFFNSRTDNYPKLAAVYKFLNYKPIDNPIEYVENRNSLVEMVVKGDKSELSESLQKWQSQDPDIRKLGFSLAVENFNNKYKNFLPKQKELLKEYIMRDAASESLKTFVVNLITETVKDINSKLSLISDTALKVKITESLPLLNEVKKIPVLKDNHVNAVLKLCQLQFNVNQIAK